MKTIQLTQGQVAKVDDHWFDYLNQWKWTAQKSYKSPNVYYAIRRVTLPSGKRETIMMHNLVNHPPRGMETDHIDGNGLNNQEYNLRSSTHSENLRNYPIRKDNKSGFKGVHWGKKKKRWIARIQINEKRIYLGMHKTEEQAARAYDTAAVKYFGEFAKLNFPR